MQIIHVIKFAFPTKIYILLCYKELRQNCTAQTLIYQVVFTGFTFSLQISLRKNKAISAGI